MAPWSILFTANPHIWTNIFIGTATMAPLPKILCSTPSYTGPTLSFATRTYLKKNNDTLGLPSAGVTTPNRNFTDCNQNWTFTLVSRTVTLSPIHEWTRTKRLVTSIWWSSTQKAWVRASGTFVTKWESLFTSRIFWWPPRTRTTSLAKEG